MSTTPASAAAASATLEADASAWYRELLRQVDDHIRQTVARPIGRLVTLAYVIDGGGSPIPTGLAGDMDLDVPCLLTGVRLKSRISGELRLDILRAPFGQYPTFTSITGSAQPSLNAFEAFVPNPYYPTTAVPSPSLPSSWTTRFSAGDTLAFNVLSNGGNHQRVTVSLRLRVLGSAPSR